MITVKTTTGTVQVGGEFNRALAQIKAISGRKFDSSTRTWSVPISARELKIKVSLPIEMPNGDHVTRYGNTYSHNEWQAEQEYKAVSIRHSDARQAVRQWLEDELGKWIAADKVAQIAGIIESAKLPALIENGTIRATEEKIAALYAIEAGYYIWAGLLALQARLRGIISGKERKCFMIEATTKPTGSGSDWLEIGTFVVDEFGDKVWKPATERYPNKDSRLKIKRDYDGRGASQRIYWKIIVPDGYDKTIVCRSGKGVDSVLYDPNDLPKA